MKPVTRALPRHLMGTDRTLNVVLVGAGGNGSEFFDGLIRLHQGLIALGAPGINVTVYDDDTVSESNIVRQRFWPHEIGLPKADALVQRSNMMMGTAWHSQPSRFDPEKHSCGDLLVTAVDNVAIRQAIANAHIRGNPLWLDMGCDRKQGQCVLGAHQDRALTDDLPNVVAHYPDMMSQLDDSRPSCSAAESIQRQDLMINSVVAASAINLLWQSLRTGKIPFNGTVIDLAEGRTQAIPFLSPRP